MKEKLINNQNALFFYIALIIFVASAHFKTFQSVFDILEIIATILLCINIFQNFKKMGQKQRIITIALCLFVLLVYYFSRSIFIVKFLLLLLAAINIDFEQCIKVDFYVRLICILLVILFNYIGIIPTENFVRNGVLRYSLGFHHPNDLAYRVAVLFLEYVYISKYKISIKQILVLVFSLVFVYVFTNSRSSLILILLFYCGGLYTTYSKNKILENKVIKKIIPYTYFILSVLIMLAVFLYAKQTSIGIYINQVFSRRFYWIYRYFNQFGIPFFGNNLNKELKVYALDVTYANILIRYGVIMFIIVGVYFKKLFNYFYSRKKYLLIIIFFIFLIYGMSEHSWLRLEQNIFMLQFVYLFKDDKGERHENSKKKDKKYKEK